MARDPYERYTDEYQDAIQEEAPQKQTPASQPPRKRRGGISQKDAMLVGSVLLAGILLVSVVVMVFGNIIKPGTKPVISTVSSQPGVGVSVSGVSSAPPITLAQDPSAWNLQIISPAKPVEANFTPPELASMAQNDVLYWFDARMIEMLQKMWTDCNAVEGFSLRIVSGYCSYNRQSELYTYFFNNYKGLGLSDEEAAAKAREHELPPGTTEHHTGLAVDFVTGSVQEPNVAFDQTAEFAWLKEHSVEYGFILRYAAEKTDITGIPYQPYHFRYVGVEDAQKITAMGITLEEYVSAVAPQVVAVPSAPEVVPSK